MTFTHWVALACIAGVVAAYVRWRRVSASVDRAADLDRPDPHWAEPEREEP